MRSEREIRARYKALKKLASPSDHADQHIIAELEWILEIPSSFEKWCKKKGYEYNK